MSCQKCRTPLKLEDSLHSLNAASFDLLVGTDEEALGTTTKDFELPYQGDRKERHDVATSKAKGPLVGRTMPPARRGISARSGHAQNSMTKDNPAMSFVMLTDSQLQTHSTSGVLRVSQADQKAQKPEQNLEPLEGTIPFDTANGTRLFDVLSSRSDIDHPICNDCTEILLTSLQSRLSESLKERDAYAGFLKNMKNHSITSQQVANSYTDYTKIKKSENKAFSTLLLLEQTKNELEEELASLDAESQLLDLEETRFWETRNAHDQQLASLQETYEALRVSLDHDVQHLARLERTNVYNDTFFISHDGPFGTINGLRLGRLSPPNNVEWPEINAAWGTAALLIATVAERLNFTFKGYTIRPAGNSSRIERLDITQPSFVNQGEETPIRTKAISLELYSSGDLPLGRQILHRRFNEAMVAFLDCLKQLCERTRGNSETGRRVDSVALPPYVIERDKINGVSIKLGVSQDEAWTTACKYTLTCCKFLLAHISNIS